MYLTSQSDDVDTISGARYAIYGLIHGTTERIIAMQIAQRIKCMHGIRERNTVWS